MQRLQKVLPEIFQSESTKKDFFLLPKALILKVVSSSETLVSESQLFKVIEERLLKFKAGESASNLEDNTSDD